jgi:hypothetical protein
VVERNGRPEAAQVVILEDIAEAKDREPPTTVEEHRPD